eukprot:1802114-Rhodomonas_salina.1
MRCAVLRSRMVRYCASVWCGTRVWCGTGPGVWCSTALAYGATEAAGRRLPPLPAPSSIREVSTGHRVAEA